jgi:hypothetical protein
MARDMLQSALKLSDRKSFRDRYLQPAIAEGFIEMTLPEKPNSRLQKLPNFHHHVPLDFHHYVPANFLNHVPADFLVPAPVNFQAL